MTAQRTPHRTAPPPPPPMKEPTPQVRDPGMRAYLDIERRALRMRLAAVERALGIDTPARPRTG